MKPFIHKHIRPEAASIFCLLLFFVAACLLYCFTTPLWVPPDEDRHYVYCEYIARHGSLPYLDAREDGFKVAQAIHPPLYYLLAALFCPGGDIALQSRLVIDESPGYGIIRLDCAEASPGCSGIVKSAYLIRLLSIIFSALTVYCVYRLALIIFSGEYYTSLAAAMLVAANPQFVHVSASISNEPMSSFFASLFLLAMVVYSGTSFGVRRQLVTGLLLGCCLLIKTSTIVYAPVTFIALAAASPKDLSAVLKKCSIIIGTAAAVAGWWYFRNWLVFDDPVFSKALNMMQPWSFRGESLSLEYVLYLAKMSFFSFFGLFGAMQVPLSPLHYGLYGMLVAAAASGYVVRLVRKGFSFGHTRIAAIMAGAVACGIVLYCFFNITYAMAMGRYLFVVIAPIALCLTAGMSMVVTGPRRPLVMLAVSCLMIGVFCDSYVRIIRPSFAETGLHPGIQQKEFCCDTPAISPEHEIQQTFVAPGDNLCAIRVLFARPHKHSTGTVRFTLRSEDARREKLVTILVPAGEIQDYSKFLFVFPPVTNSRGNLFTFAFDALGPAGAGYPSLVYDKGTAREDTRLSFDTVRQQGTLFFETYHASGHVPANKWQGTRAAYIDEGWYVAIRELQLYGEFSSRSKLWEQVHEKIQRIEQALVKRAEMMHSS